jgi:hypothetical protein
MHLARPQRGQARPARALFMIVLPSVAGGVFAAAGCGGSPGGVPTGAPSAAPVETGQSSRPAPTPSPAGRPAAGFREITFDDIKLEMEKGAPFARELLPERVKALVGTPIRIRGYILPSFQQTGLTQFVLVRDNQECCFGPGAALHDCIVVRMRPGKTADFSIRPVAVAGTFTIDELRAPDGSHLAIYALAGDEVK